MSDLSTDLSVIDAFVVSVLKYMNIVIYSMILISVSGWGMFKAKRAFDKWFEENVPDKKKVESDISDIKIEINKYSSDMQGAVKELRMTIQDLKMFFVEERGKSVNKIMGEISSVKERVAKVEGIRSK